MRLAGKKEGLAALPEESGFCHLQVDETPAEREGTAVRRGSAGRHWLREGRAGAAGAAVASSPGRKGEHVGTGSQAYGPLRPVSPGASHPCPFTQEENQPGLAVSGGDRAEPRSGARSWPCCVPAFSFRGSACR